VLYCNGYDWQGRDWERNLDFKLRNVSGVTVVWLTLLEPLAKKRSKQSFGCRMLEGCAKENSENHVQVVKISWWIYFVLFSSLRVCSLAHRIKYKGKDKYLWTNNAVDWEVFLFQRSAIMIEVLCAWCPLFRHENTGIIPEIRPCSLLSTTFPMLH
jgi:hypothetical protein